MERKNTQRYRITGQSLIFPTLQSLSISYRTKTVLLLCLFAMPLFALGQEQTYSINGQAVDENGRDIRAAVFAGPSYTRWPGADLNNEISPTDNRGFFRLVQSASAGQTWYLFLTAGEHTGLELLSVPFAGVGKLDRRFQGRPIKFGTEQKVSLGKIPVSFWFESVDLILRKNGQNLTSSEWKGLWCRIKNEKGKVLSGLSLGPVLRPDEIDLNTSTLHLTLPEGKWRIEFQGFDDAAGKISPKVIASTGYFIVRRRHPLAKVVILTN